MPASTGPYKLVQWVPNQQIVLERNEDYWGRWTGGEAGRIIVRIVSRVSTQLQMLHSGEADLTFATVPLRYGRDPETDPTSKWPSIGSWQYLPGPINTKRKQTDNLEVPPGAHSHYGLRDGLFADLCRSGVRAELERPWRCRGAKGADMPKFDLDKAKQLIEESGVPEDRQDHLGRLWRHRRAQERGAALPGQRQEGRRGCRDRPGRLGRHVGRQKKVETSFNVPFTPSP